MPPSIDSQRFRGILLRSFIWTMVTQGVTYAELAIFLHITRSTVGGLLHRAKRDKVSSNTVKLETVLTPEEYASFFGKAKQKSARPGPKAHPNAVPSPPPQPSGLSKYFEDDDDWDYIPPVLPVKPSVDKPVKIRAEKPALSVAVIKKRSRAVAEGVYAPQLRELFPYPPEPTGRPRAHVPHSQADEGSDDELDAIGRTVPREFDYQKAIEPKGSSDLAPPHFVCMNASEINDKVCQVVVGHDGTAVNGRYVPLYCGHPRVPDLKFMFCRYHASYMLVHSSSKYAPRGYSPGRAAHARIQNKS